MKPTTFPDANQVWVMPDDPDGDLHTQNDGHQLLSCWTMSPRERLSAVLFGRVWLGVQSQNQPPVWLTCERDAHDIRTGMRGHIANFILWCNLRRAGKK